MTSRCYGPTLLPLPDGWSRIHVRFTAGAAYQPAVRALARYVRDHWTRCRPPPRLSSAEAECRWTQAGDILMRILTAYDPIRDETWYRVDVEGR